MSQLTQQYYVNNRSLPHTLIPVSRCNWGMKNTRRTHLADAMTNTEGPTLWYDVVYRTQIHSVYEVLKLMQSSSPVKK